MAKQRLVDFRGGINQKISSHMIGDSQGQDAQDVDLTSVRLEGRRNIDNSVKANGSFFYEPGGNWVSIYPEDDTYLTGATDFSVWNRDLYVAFGENSTTGEVQVYRDGAQTATQLNFNPPSSGTYTTYNASSTTEFLAPYSSTVPSEILIASVAGITYQPPVTNVTVTVTNAGDFDPPYVIGSYNNSHSRYTWTKSGDTKTYYSSSNTTGNIQENTGGSGAYTITLSSSTAGDFDPPYETDGTFNDASSRSGVENFTFNVYRRETSAGSQQYNYYYFAPSTNGTLNVSANSFYTRSGGGTAGGGAVSDSQYNSSTYYWGWTKDAGYSGSVSNISGNSTYYVTLNNSYNGQFETDGTFTDSRAGTSNHTFNRYQLSNNTSQKYYAPTANVTINGINLVSGYFYTQSGGTGTTGNTPVDEIKHDANHYWKWTRDASYSGTISNTSGASDLYTTLNSTYNGNFSPTTVTGGSNNQWSDSRSGVTITQTFNTFTDGSTNYYAPTSTANSLTQGRFYTQSGGGTSTQTENTKWVWNRTASASYSYSNGIYTPDQSATNGYWYTIVNSSGSSNSISVYFKIQLGGSSVYLRIYYPSSASGYFKGYASAGNNTLTSLTYVRTDGTTKTWDGSRFPYDYIQEYVNIEKIYGTVSVSGTSYSFTLVRGSKIQDTTNVDWYSFTHYNNTGTLTVYNTSNTQVHQATNVSVSYASFTSGGYTYNRNDSARTPTFSSTTPSSVPADDSPLIESYTILSNVSNAPYRSTEVNNDYTYSQASYSGDSIYGTTSIYWDGASKLNETGVTYANATTQVSDTINSVVYTYARDTTQITNLDSLKEFKIKRSYTSSLQYEDYTYSLYTYQYSPSTGTTTFYWNGSAVQTYTGQTFASASTSYTQTENIGGNNVSVSYTRSGSNRTGNPDAQKFTIVRAYTAPTYNVNYTYSLHTNSQSFAATYTYGNITDTIPAVAGKPETPAFTYDDARSKLYLEYNQSADVGAETIDNAQGALWLANDRGFTLTDDGYYLQTVREDVVNNIGLPVLSNDLLKATLTAGSHHVFGRSLESTPQRLNFSITQPTDVTTPAFKCYKLQRRDNIATIDLGYISPDSGISFSYNASTKVVSISGLDSSTPASYRLKFTGYQDTQVQTSLTESGSSTASVSQSKSNMTGLDFDGNDTLVITLVAGTDTTFHAADFWLEKKIFEINTSTTSDDIYATVRCFDVFDRNGNAIQTGVITGTSDYLDAFPNGVSSGVVSDSTPTGVPTYLKFLRESNNFFFAVGTESTPDNRYSSTNKADSYLFISEYNNPRSWPLSGYLEFEDSITGLASYPGELIVWTQNGVYRVTGSRYDQMRKSKLATTEGLPLNQEKSIALVNRYLVWVSQSGICFYNGESVVNLSRGRIPNFSMSGNSLHASQFNDIYYVLDSTETGYSVDFSLEGFPISRVDLTEGDTNAPANSSAEVLPPVLVYRPSVNRLYSRRGIIGGSSTKNSWSYKTRGFDGGAFGSLKLVRNVTINGEGSGYVQIYLDGKPVFKNSSNVATPKQVTITETTRTEPARIYVPASSDTIYGLSIADVWSVEITNWEGVVDWIDTEYEIISGG